MIYYLSHTIKRFLKLIIDFLQCETSKQKKQKNVKRFAKLSSSFVLFHQAEQIVAIFDQQNQKKQSAIKNAIHY